MLKNTIISSLILASSLCANTSIPKKNENVQILAENLNNQGNIVKASGNILIFSPTYYITAKELIYNKEDQTLELFNDVNILKDNKLLTVSDYAFLDFKNDTSLIRPILLLDKESNLWIKSKESKKEKNIQFFKSSTLSSCDCDSPLWSIAFSSGDFNTEEKWVNTYNSRLKIGPIPVFYTPWFGFSTDKTRRTGLLQPTFGYDNTEGFVYSQPLYIAPSANWDIEFTPQIRAKRGNGLYSTYRYTAKDSTLEISTGYFKEQKDYMDANNIEHDAHYGIDLEYKSTNVLSNNSSEDGLLISLHSLNDVGYNSLRDTSESIYNISDNIITSKIDYFYNSNNYFTSSEFRYFKDIESGSNQDEILQQLPKLKLHSFSKEISDLGILYSSDFSYNNQTREDGVGANTYTLSIPFSYNTTIFNDFINIKFQEQIGSTFIQYKNDGQYEDAIFTENKHIINISTDLIKPYEEYIHAFNLQSTITIPNTIKQKGDIYFTPDDNSNLSPFPITKTKKNINFSLNQSMFDKESLKEIINHKIDQSIIYENNQSDLGDLRNELTYYYAYGKISHKLTYNHLDSMITNTSTSIDYKEDNFFFRTNHTNTLTSESISYEIGNKFNRYYSVSYKENYNIAEHINNIKEYTLDINKRCWGLNIKLADNLVAAPTTGNDAIRQKIIYFLFTMKPIGKFKQQYELNKEK
jgi:LPS-assembly protein